MDTIRISNQEDFTILAELRWAGNVVHDCIVAPHSVGELPCTGLAAIFDIDIRMVNSEKTWIAGAQKVPRNITLTLTHHIVWDLNR